MKTVLYVAAIVCVGFAAFFVIGRIAHAPSNLDGQAFDPRNATYVVEGQEVTLRSGVAEQEAAPGSASKIITRYFGNEASGDLTGDGRDERAFLLTQERGGSGVFYYAVVAVPTEGDYMTTNVFFVGDRIAPQSTHINESAHELYINYATRASDEPMTAQPSVGATLYLKVTKDLVLEGLMR